MFIIAGLGNPGRQYDATRHNAGFAALLTLADRHHIRVSTPKGKALTGTGIIGGQKVLLAMPQTYMNLSGESILALTSYFGIDPETELIILCDDINLDVGALRLRAKGSAGGHNGLKNIIALLKTQDFARVRLGVGNKPEKMDLADYVLGHFDEKERELMRKAQEMAADAVEMILEDGMDKAMNRFNVSAKKPKEKRNLKENGNNVSSAGGTDGVRAGEGGLIQGEGPVMD